MSQTTAAEKSHLATLDILRLVAALAVVLFHYFFRGAAEGDHLAEGYPEVAGYALYGYLGVNLFFLISGFVIAWSAEGRAWEQFALARFVRLYPGYLICMTLTFVVLTLASSPLFPVNAAQYAANLTMFAPALGQAFMDGVYWSIVLELVFYGWLTLALLTGLFDRFKLELIAGWLALCALNEFAIGSGALRMLFITEFGPYFAAGILVHHMLAKGRSVETLMLFAAAFLMSCNTLRVTQGWMLEHYGTAVPLPHLIVANVVMHAMLVAAVRFRGLVRPSALTLGLGGLTYPLYLLHQNIGYLAIDAAAPAIGKWAAALLTILVAAAVSWAIWRFVERPSQRALRRTLSPLVDKLLAAMRSRLPANPLAQ